MSNNSLKLNLFFFTKIKDTKSIRKSSKTFSQIFNSNIQTSNLRLKADKSTFVCILVQFNMRNKAVSSVVITRTNIWQISFVADIVLQPVISTVCVESNPQPNHPLSPYPVYLSVYSCPSPSRLDDLLLCCMVMSLFVDGVKVGLCHPIRGRGNIIIILSFLPFNPNFTTPSLLNPYHTPFISTPSG